MAEKVYIEHEGLPSEGLMLDGIDTLVSVDGRSSGPTFEPGEITKIFFNRSSHWLRWRERQGHIVYDGEVVGSRTDVGSRYYTLGDVEKMIHALMQNGAVDAQRGYNALMVVRYIAIVHGYLVVTDEPVG